MRAFYLEYKLVPPAAAQFNELEHLGILAQIPWSHNIVLMEKLDVLKNAFGMTILKHGWSRDMLFSWIASKLYKREGSQTSSLPAPQVDLAQQALKDSFLSLIKTI
jgi:DUF1016 N-terminal domain